MLYLFGVYGLVVIAVFLPILLLYIVAGLSLLVLKTARLLIGRVRVALSAQFPVRASNLANLAKIANTRKVA